MKGKTWLGSGSEPRAVSPTVAPRCGVTVTWDKTAVFGSVGGVELLLGGFGTPRGPVLA